MMNMKKLLALLLAMVMVVGMIPFGALAEETELCECTLALGHEGECYYRHLDTCAGKDCTGMLDEATACECDCHFKHADGCSETCEGVECDCECHLHSDECVENCEGETKLGEECDCVCHEPVVLNLEKPSEPEYCACGLAKDHEGECQKCECGLVKNHEGDCQKAEPEYCACGLAKDHEDECQKCECGLMKNHEGDCQQPQPEYCACGLVKDHEGDCQKCECGLVKNHEGDCQQPQPEYCVCGLAKDHEGECQKCECGLVKNHEGDCQKTEIIAQKTETFVQKILNAVIPQATTPTLEVTMNVYDAATNQSIPGVTMLLRRRVGDPGNHLATAVTDENGIAHFSLPVNSDGTITDSGNHKIQYNAEDPLDCDPVAPEGFSWAGTQDADWNTRTFVEGTNAAAKVNNAEKGIHDAVLTGNWATEGAAFTFNCYLNVPTYTVSFSGYAADQPVKYRETATKPEDPVNGSATFKGWYLDGEPYDFSTPVTGDITLTPRWEASEDIQGIVHFNVYLWDYDEYDPNNPASARTNIPVEGLEFKIVTYKDGDSSTMPNRLREGLARTDPTDSNGQTTLTLTKEHFEKLIYGELTIIDCDPDPTDAGWDSRNGDAYYDWDWGIKEIQGEAGVKGVRTISDGMRNVRRGTNPNEVAVLNAEAFVSGFEFTFNCYVSPSHTVLFDTDGGTPEPETQHFEPRTHVDNAGENYVTRPTDPAKDGYVFGGWYIVDRQTGEMTANEFNFSKPINESFILRAKWTKEPATVTWRDEDQVTVLQTSTDEMGFVPQYVEAQPTKPNENGYKYTFAGWDRFDTNEIEKIALRGPFPATTQKQTYYDAQYERSLIQYLITYKPEGGTITGTDYTTNYTVENQVTIPNATREGYTFQGWKVTVVEEEGNWIKDQQHQPQTFEAGKFGNVTLTAIWEENTIKINYEAVGGGSVDPASEDVKLTADASGSLATANPGYSFEGWYKNENCTEAVDTSWVADQKITPQMVDGKNVAATYYAKFVEDEVTINYKVVGPEGCGTVNPTSETLKAETGVAQGSTAATANNSYRFVGWYKEQACITLLSKDAHYTPAKVNGLNVAATYYAKFELGVADLTITKNVSNGLNGEKPGFVFTIVGKEGTNTAGVNMTISMGAGSVTIKDLPIGEYTVTEDMDWAKNYTGGGTQHVTVDADGGEAEFTNTRIDEWLTWNTSRQNLFDGNLRN